MANLKEKQILPKAVMVCSFVPSCSKSKTSSLNLRKLETFRLKIQDDNLFVLPQSIPDLCKNRRSYQNLYDPSQSELLP